MTLPPQMPPQMPPTKTGTKTGTKAGPRLAPQADQKVGRTTFLERSTYRRRRVIDAIKLLPVLGACLFVLPAVILGEGSGSTAPRLVYFFVSWAALIALCAVLVRGLPREVSDGSDGLDGPDRPGGPDRSPG